MPLGFRRSSPALLGLAVLAALGADQRLAAQQQPASEYDYLLLATNKTSTMQKEMQKAAEAGYAFVGVMGGETSFGGSEVVVVMGRLPDSLPRFEYLLLATSKTSTMQKELQEAGDAGFSFRGQTVFGTTFGGDEPVVILERDRDVASPELFEYRTSCNKEDLYDGKGTRRRGCRWISVCRRNSGIHEVRGR